MTLTKNDVRERLRQLDEFELLEILDVNSDILVERFDDIIDERYEKLLEIVDWE